ncbi:hypothetical protein KUTeg_022679 [Tegillarca granosa]|uniref:non-specific serine/threonine protein kinase n=1 Tax=Tegillarca granosa TaxID=220873 RepID=A0ABQ9E384_TEGGR|nr:hypothetical protein KUTeg_022679 [Tegillarca granosa]
MVFYLQGEKYDGRKADVWSCGVILYALLVLEDIHRHPWVLADSQGQVELELPVTQIVQTSIIPTVQDLDPDVLSTMNSLQCFKDKDRLVQELLNAKHNTEKVVYFLLLDRKLRNPSIEDEMDIRARSESGKSSLPLNGHNKSVVISVVYVDFFAYSLDFITDPPRKRVDAVQLNGQPSRKASLSGSPSSSPVTSPRLPVRRTPSHSPSATPPGSPCIQTTPWKSRLHTIKNSLMGSPRFHRRKLQGIPYNNGVIMDQYLAVPTEDVSMTPDSSPEMTKKSWFGALMGSEREEHHFIMAQDKPLSQVKADLVHAFLSTADLSHSVVSTTTFRAEYRRSGSSSMFSRNVRFQVDISPAHGGAGGDCQMYCLTFTLIAGPSRRFRRVCEHLQNLMLGPRGDALNQRKVSTDSASSYTSETGTSPSHSCSTKENVDEEVFEPKRISKTPTPTRREVPRVITNGKRVLVDHNVRKDKV